MQNDSLMKPYSDETAGMIDEEVRQLLQSQFERAKNLLQEKRQALEALAQQLLEKEVLLKSDVEKLIGPRAGSQKAVEAAKNNSHQNGSDMTHEIAVQENENEEVAASSPAGEVGGA